MRFADTPAGDHGFCLLSSRICTNSAEKRQQGDPADAQQQRQYCRKHLRRRRRLVSVCGICRLFRQRDTLQQRLNTINHTKSVPMYMVRFFRYCTFYSALFIFRRYSVGEHPATLRNCRLKLEIFRNPQSKAISRTLSFVLVRRLHAWLMRKWEMYYMALNPTYF